MTIFSFWNFMADHIGVYRNGGISSILMLTAGLGLRPESAPERRGVEG